MENITALISQYGNMLSNIEFHKIAADQEQEKAREILKEIQAQIGNAPFEVNGREVAILVRRGVIQTMPTVRPRKPKGLGTATKELGAE